MNIRLAHSIVKKLELKRNSDDDSGEDNCDLSFSVGYDNDNEKEFAIFFFVQLRSQANLKIELEYSSYFETSEQINDEFKASHFPKINAPAIAFPFLRSFIATLTVNAGYTPVMLPSVNFTKVKTEDNNIFNL